jgi:hypothetical protein
MERAKVASTWHLGRYGHCRTVDESFGWYSRVSIGAEAFRSAAKWRAVVRLVNGTIANSELETGAGQEARGRNLPSTSVGSGSCPLALARMISFYALTYCNVCPQSSSQHQALR